MKRITGMMVYYYFVCKRKLWYFLHYIQMEENSELVALGKILDETTYARKKKGILIDDTINIDFIESKAIVHEVKKTKAIEEAGIWQVKYYMYYLMKNGIEVVEGKIDYPLIRETKEILLEKEDVRVIENILKEIGELMIKDKPPEIMSSKICKKCAYFDLCYV